MIYLKLFLSFLKVGTFTFGGGYAMIPLIQEEVIYHGWMKLEKLIDFIAISESSPGPFAINIATFVGSKTGGFLGALLATLGVIFTSFVLIVILARNYDKFKKSKIVRGCMMGLKPAVVGLIGAAVITTGIAVFFPEGVSFSTFSTIVFWKSLIIFLIALVLSLKKMHPIKTIILSAILGILLGFV